MPALTRTDKLRILSETSLFAQLGEGALGQIAERSRVKALARRQDLFHKGDAASQLYVVVRGTLKVVTTSAEADDIVFALHSSGDVIGEIALFAQCPRTATVRALEDCELLVIDRRDVLDVVRRHPDVAIQLIELLAQRLKRLSEFLEDTQFLNLPYRLAKQIDHLARRYGSQTAQGIRIELPLSQEEWGDLVGATREAVNKQLGEWREAGWVSLEGRFVTVHDPAALQRIAGDPIA